MSRRILSDAQIREIAKVYDGRTETIDHLVRKMKCQRHNITSAAKRLGLSRSGERKTWTPEDDAYLRDNYGLTPVPDLCQQLHCSPLAIRNRKRRLGISTRLVARDLGYTILDLEKLLGVDHRLWKNFIDSGELKVTELWVGQNTPQARIVSIESLQRFLKRRPEFVDYRNASLTARMALELDALPEPPLYKRLICRSDALSRNREFNDSIRKQETRAQRNHLPACSEKPFGFWAPAYSDSQPACPRCGSMVSQFSDYRQYRDDDPGEADILRMLASKLGLRFQKGRVCTNSGRALANDELIEYAFNCGRNPRQAFRVFAKLLESGLSPIKPRPAAKSKFKRTLMDYSLMPRQKAAWRRFLSESNVGIYWPPGEGKMYFGAYAAGRIPGRHLILVNSTLLRDQWAEFFRSHAIYGADAVGQKTPHGRLVRLYEADGSIRSEIQILTYSTRIDLLSMGRFDLLMFDEAHFLPGNRAHRFALVDARYRIGMTASKYREDGRADLLEMLIGRACESSWADVLAERDRPPPPIRVCVVDDFDAKLREAAHRISHRRRGIVFIERIAEGRKLAAMTGFPFIHGGTKRRFQAIRDNPRVILSRVGDHGLDIEDLQFVVEFGFFRGSRMQQLQRYGRLLHSKRTSHYLILMTREEFSRYYKRLSALEDQGLRFRIDMAQPRHSKHLRGKPSGKPHTNGWRNFIQMLGAAA